MFEDKYSFSQDQNRRFAKMNLTRLVFTNSKFVGVNTTLPQTQTIIDGVGVNGISIDDINMIVQLKRGWQYIINEDRPISMRVMKNINSIVVNLNPKEFKDGSTSIGKLMSSSIDEHAEENYLQELLKDENKSVTEKSIEMMYHLMKYKIFWNGNKRTATLIANKFMIDNGVGLINIPLYYWDEWNKLISDYYYDNDMSKIKEWTYKVGIQGIDIFKTSIKDKQ